MTIPFAMKTSSHTIGRRFRPAWLFAVCLLLSGCPDSSEPEPGVVAESPYRDVDLRLVVPDGLNLAEQWAPAVNDWADENNASVEIAEVSFADDEAWAETINAKSPTIALLPSPLVNDFVGSESIALMPESVTADGVIAWNAIPPAPRRVLGTLSQKPAIVPITDAVPLICYRADLLESAGIETPQTWAEYDALTQNVGDWGAGLSVVEPWATDFRATLFLARAASAARHPDQFSMELDAATGEPLIATEPFVTALKEVAVHLPHLADGVLAMSPADCIQQLRDGRAAMGVIWVKGDRDNLARSEAEDITLEFVPLPGRERVFHREERTWVTLAGDAMNRPAYSGFSGLSIVVVDGAREVEQAAGWDLWGLMERYIAEGVITPPPGPPIRSKAVPSAALNLPFNGDNRQRFERAVVEHRRLSLCVAELPVLGQEQLRSQVTAAITAVLENNATPEEALSSASEKWAATIEDIGPTKVLNSYRRRLGLTPLSE